MSFAIAESRNSHIANINITPLVDVMLVLLVIFMIAAPIASHTMPIDLPQGDPQTASKNVTLKLAIEAGDVYTLDGVAMGQQQLRQRFEQAAAASGLPVIVEVRANPEAEYQSVAQGLALARNAGLQNFNFLQ